MRRFAIFSLIGSESQLGASGAIAAAPDAFLVTYPRDRMQVVLVIGWFVHITFIPAALLIGLWFVIQLVSVGAVANVNTSGIAYVAHIARHDLRRCCGAILAQILSAA